MRPVSTPAAGRAEVVTSAQSHALSFSRHTLGLTGFALLKERRVFVVEVRQFHPLDLLADESLDRKNVRGILRHHDGKCIPTRLRPSRPADPEDYIHRIGRTGRAEARGDAFT